MGLSMDTYAIIVREKEDFNIVFNLLRYNGFSFYGDESCNYKDKSAIYKEAIKYWEKHDYSTCILVNTYDCLLYVYDFNYIVSQKDFILISTDRFLDENDLKPMVIDMTLEQVSKSLGFEVNIIETKN